MYNNNRHLEAARYIETYKSYENKPPDLIMEKTEDDYSSQVGTIHCVIIYTTLVEGHRIFNEHETREQDRCDDIDKKFRSNDVVLRSQLNVTSLQSIKGICLATIEELSFCPGIGLLKVSTTMFCL